MYVWCVSFWDASFRNLQLDGPKYRYAIANLKRNVVVRHRERSFSPSSWDDPQNPKAIVQASPLPIHRWGKHWLLSCLSLYVCFSIYLSVSIFLSLFSPFWDNFQRIYPFLVLYVWFSNPAAFFFCIVSFMILTAGMGTTVFGNTG